MLAVLRAMLTVLGPSMSSRRLQMLQYVVSALQKLAATRDVAVVILSQCATRMQAERGATLIPAINANVWEQGIATRVALLRDWMWDDGHPYGARLAAIQKINGKTAADGLDRLFAFSIDSVGRAAPCLVRYLLHTDGSRRVWFRRILTDMLHLTHSLAPNESWARRASRSSTAKMRTTAGRRKTLACCQGCLPSGRVVKTSYSAKHTTRLKRTATAKTPSRRTVISLTRRNESPQIGLGVPPESPPRQNPKSHLREDGHGAHPYNFTMALAQ